ncbi:MAG TPA: hypothetical protein VGP72_10410 [Planctomycetota bacterium]
MKEQISLFGQSICITACERCSSPATNRISVPGTGAYDLCPACMAKPDAERWLLKRGLLQAMEEARKNADQFIEHTKARLENLEETLERFRNGK